MKNKNKYDLHKIEWKVSRGTENFDFKNSTKVFLNENGKKIQIAHFEGGANSDFLNWLEEEAR